MGKQSISEPSIDLISLVNSHEKPFVVINRDYQIMAVNTAYEKEYKISHNHSVGKMCYQVIRGREHPCHLDGDECPHEDIFNCAQDNPLSPMHYEATHHAHQVKITAFPLKNSNNELFLGKCVDEVLGNHEKTASNEYMVGNSPAYLELINHLDVAANSDVPVLLQGETGTGKELAAAYIHKHSSRSSSPLQIIDSTVLTESMFESEMFGHANGAFSGCVGDKLGLFELTDGGTIFFDKIGDLSLPLQSKLLRLIESGSFRRVGGSRMRSADVRIVCATNKNLWQRVSNGEFREDLYHRIACLNIQIPSLAERSEDIPVLARALLERINHENATSCYLLPESAECLKSYLYSGNIRELKNILFIATTQCRENKIDEKVIEDVFKQLPHITKITSTHKSGRKTETGIPSASDITRQDKAAVSLKNIERQHIIDLLEEYEGNRKKAADALGISERTMYRKLVKLGINKTEK